MIKKITISLLLTISILNRTIVFSDEVATPAIKSEEAIIEEIRWLHEEYLISIATKHETPLSKAPGVATVITAKQIKQMGFRTLADILKTVPGYDVQMNGIGTKNVSVRGGGFQNSEKVRFLIDGHAINDPYWGGAMNNFWDMVVGNIKRLEVIRGPGSALFGKNAFLGVVNIVTKDIADIDGFQWTGSGGSFDTQNYNMLFAKEYGDIEISGFFDYFDTNGFDEKLERDTQFTKPWSMSPERTNNKREKTDLNLKLSYKNLELKGKYMKKRRDAYIGIGGALTDDNNLEDTYIFAELVYNLSLGEKLKMTPKAYYDRYDFDWKLESLPEGFVDPFGRPYADGIKGLTALTLNTLGFEDQFNYDVFDGNRLTFGFQYEWLYQHNARSANLTFDPSGAISPFGLFGAVSPPQDFSDTFPFTKDKKTRQIWSLYLQDEWNITENIDLTVGVRHDNFTRFEGTTNPRVGLVWRFIEDAYLKLLFATAFRAPNFREMFLQNNALIEGNSNLDPEKINTYEFQVGYNLTQHINGSVNFFYNRTRDLIILALQPGSSYKYQNSGGSRVAGAEAEIMADLGGDNYAYANYTYQNAKNTDRNRLMDMPVHKANFGVNMRVTKYINADLHTFVSGRRPREIGGTRDDLPSYAVVDCTLIGKNFMDNFEIRGSVQNLFDKDYADPSGLVPSNNPQPERSFRVELRFQY